MNIRETLVKFAKALAADCDFAMLAASVTQENEWDEKFIGDFFRNLSKIETLTEIAKIIPHIGRALADKLAGKLESMRDLLVLEAETLGEDPGKYFEETGDAMAQALGEVAATYEKAAVIEAVDRAKTELMSFKPYDSAGDMAATVYAIYADDFAGRLATLINEAAAKGDARDAASKYADEMAEKAFAMFVFDRIDIRGTAYHYLKNAGETAELRKFGAEVKDAIREIASIDFNDAFNEFSGK